MKRNYGVSPRQIFCHGVMVSFAMLSRLEGNDSMFDSKSGPETSNRDDGQFVLEATVRLDRL